ncbi:MAG: hypothetical protein JNK48_30785 [Bryobacterales bacterium]|nr:hypothetical protein [Bryobacterales bacterium]
MKLPQFLLVALMSVLVAGAQSGLPALNAQISFPFEMRGKVLPAGEYTVDFGADRAWLTVRSREEVKDAAIAVAFPVVPKTNGCAPHLVFNRYGDRYFLSQVWHPNVVRELPRSRQERELVTSRVFALKPVRVIIAAKLVR